MTLFKKILGLFRRKKTTQKNDSSIYPMF